ncbi:UDP-3-O-acyl-N-acetylglucosamine deacetylase [Yoonia sediminilitoris]|uniref:UDP-3-O-acyl-N-acetylglucosamine deacetylase n=1 Tax=Yoonia sediminilitoris TaxID=1286148 RepID=A0A2T6KQM6_9RHOB|nr:UDP-3-O-acyl-N-acetylglucosamine deacetylase [Yoonia sediminilitoris]PUB18835.1 UDP-3-O-[3-hydroxymyristoyl] N-acetylglucosamine deacetylase [Yoonia sediminilitoris]RCW99003.1 UDP-3-O-[3-hydroxymyristoyl] N-acetylglucosamine deacetylase [Yoonia sediminilitoris]
MQTTLKSKVTFSGVGLHTGMPVRMVLRPAAASVGIVFRRVDVVGFPILAATWNNVVVSPLNTRLVNGDGVTVSTIEHLMAALAGCGVHNAVIDIDGPEVPILDGSAAIFVRDIMNAGVVGLAAPLRAIEVMKQVSVADGQAVATLSPAKTLQIEFAIDFEDAAIGQQQKTLNLANGAFVRELCNSRTFCRSSDVEAMRANGLALGGTMENAVVVDGDKVLSPGGLRHRDEAVRHKMLDALGDLYTAGAPVLGCYRGYRAGHALTNALLRALFADDTAWRWVTCDVEMAAQLPGAGVSMDDLRAVA